MTLVSNCTALHPKHDAPLPVGGAHRPLAHRPALLPGDTMTPEQCWQLAEAWYADKSSPDWRCKTPGEAETTLAAIGLTRSFWSLRT